MNKSDYKSTLNLPKNSFPMKANLSKNENKIIDFWNEIDLYNLLKNDIKSKKSFVINDGPPYANGPIHMGHALNKILKDIINKFKILDGYKVTFIPGWDCHGLPIELKVENYFLKKKKNIDKVEFAIECRKYVNRQIINQKKDFLRIGILGDWNNFYYTMENKFQANILRSLCKIFDNGFIYRKKMPVFWCLDCKSSLAEAEIEYKDKITDSIFISFKVFNFNFFFRFIKFDFVIDDLYFILWTTTPWTLLANEAISLNPDFVYVLVGDEGKYFIVSKNLLFDFEKKCLSKNFNIICYFFGNDLEFIVSINPIYINFVPIILSTHITDKFGTGCVHIAPSNGHDDYILGKKYNLPLIDIIDNNGLFKDCIENCCGKNLIFVNDFIIKLLKQKCFLFFLHKVVHNYPFCWRHKTATIFMSTFQWFISMKKNNLKKNVLNIVNVNINWISKNSKNKMKKMLIDRPDWCISRQRMWGVPIPFFFDKKNGSIHPDNAKFINEIALEVEKNGVESWFNFDFKSLLGDDFNKYEISNDILDVWFDSGVVHDCLKNIKFPADLYVEGSDQYRGWFQTSLLSSVAINGCSPYKAVLSHGFVVDVNNEKMSKSLKNVISPNYIIENFGSDILRLWVASSDYKYDISISNEIINRNIDTYRRIRNTIRFLISNLYDFDPDHNKINFDKMLKIDLWILIRLNKLEEKILNDYKNYNFHFVCKKINNFCISELGSFYLDIIKDRLYISSKDGFIRKSSQKSMYYILLSLIKLISPILSFTSEESWQYVPGIKSKSVFLSKFNLFDEIKFINMNDKYIKNEYWERLFSIKNEVNKIFENFREKNYFKSTLDLNLYLFCNVEIYDLLVDIKNELKFIFITSSVSLNYTNDVEKNYIKTKINGLFIKIDISNYNKCPRCWHRSNDIGLYNEDKNICRRCINNLYYSSDIRYFV